jgi:hypothetical protein
MVVHEKRFFVLIFDYSWPKESEEHGHLLGTIGWRAPNIMEWSLGI